VKSLVDWENFYFDSTKEQKQTMANPAIFVSYSWKPESKAVVDEIQAALRTENIEIQRDINVLNYKGKIGEFMQLIGKGKIIILVIGKDYLESENCLYELMQIAAQGDIFERIVPIYLPSADIHKVVLRANYIKWWTEKYKEIEGLDKSILINVPQDDIYLYRNISQEIGNLMRFLGNINALSLDMHRASAWKDLKDTVKSMIKKFKEVENDNNSQNITNKTTQMTYEALKEKINQNEDGILEVIEYIEDKVPSSQKATFNGLKNELISPPNNFQLKSYQSRFKIFLSTIRINLI
jgi:hypothetical protein